MLVLLGVSYLVYADDQLRQAEQYLEQYDNTVPIENDFYRANAWIEWGRDMGWTDYQHDLTPLYSKFWKEWSRTYESVVEPELESWRATYLPEPSLYPAFKEGLRRYHPLFHSSTVAAEHLTQGQLSYDEQKAWATILVDTSWVQFCDQWFFMHHFSLHNGQYYKADSVLNDLFACHSPVDPYKEGDVYDMLNWMAFEGDTMVQTVDVPITIRPHYLMAVQELPPSSTSTKPDTFVFRISDSNAPTPFDLDYEALPPYFFYQVACYQEDPREVESAKPDGMERFFYYGTPTVRFQVHKGRWVKD